MTIEEYVEFLKPLVPSYFVENTKDWSASDKIYIFLHNIQLEKMEEFKESLEELKTLIYAKYK